MSEPKPGELSEPDFASLELRLLGIYQDISPKQRKLLAKLVCGKQLTELEKIELEMSTDAFIKQKTFDTVHGILYCWSCQRALQKPAFFKTLKGKGTNTFRMKCTCGEYTEVKW